MYKLKYIINILVHMLLVLVCLIISSYFCMKLFDDILIRFADSNEAFIFIRIMLAFLLYSLMVLLMKKRIEEYQLKILVFLYIVLLLIFSYFKGNYNSGGVYGINLDPIFMIDALSHKSGNSFILLVGNTFAYMPLGIYFSYYTKISSKALIYTFIPIITVLEFIQLIFKLGIFDMNDIILNSIGFTAGIFIIDPKFGLKALPNIISLLRIIFSLMLISVETLSNRFFIIYIICGLSDFLDGYIARNTGTSTSFGAKLDTIADMVMIAVLIFVLYPVVKPSAKIVILIAVICVVRLAAITVGLIKYKTFAGIHTYGNKITGAALFIFPFLILLNYTNVIMYLICIMGLISALEELIIQLRSTRLDLNVKCIFHI